MNNYVVAQMFTNFHSQNNDAIHINLQATDYLSKHAKAPASAKQPFSFKLCEMANAISLKKIISQITTHLSILLWIKCIQHSVLVHIFNGTLKLIDKVCFSSTHASFCASFLADNNKCRLHIHFYTNAFFFFNFDVC